MYSVDIETLGIESNSVLLSAAIIYFDLEKDAFVTFEQLVNRSLTVKISVTPQIAGPKGRQIDKATVDWWGKQSLEARKASFNTSTKDLMPADAIILLRDYIDHYKDSSGDDIFWARGSFDQMILDSFCRSFKQPVLTKYWQWRDFRTAIDLLAGNKAIDKTAQATIPGFDVSKVTKHIPAHDAAYDLLQLLSCKDPF